jgi:hypothetical protein
MGGLFFFLNPSFFYEIEMIPNSYRFASQSDTIGRVDQSPLAAL